MGNSGSYDASTSHRDRQSEIERLRAQALLSWSKEARTLGWFGLRDGMSVLELGSGPGFITEQLLDLLPSSTITALELDPGLLENARQYLHGKAQGHVQFIEASIMQTGLPEHSFDFAIARFLFQHLPDPIGAAKEVRRVLKPGGKLVIIDIDDELFGLTDPPIRELSGVLEKYGQAQAAQGGNRRIGRSLWRILREAGFVNLDLEAVVTHSDELGIEAFLPQIDPDRLLPLVQMRWLSAAELDHLRSVHAQFLASPAPYVLLIMLLACGEKP